MKKRFITSVPVLGTMVLTRFKDGRVHFRNSGMRGLTNKKCGISKELYGKNNYFPVAHNIDYRINPP